ncbi:MAG: carbon-nitrogen hydrolase family protein [Rubrobacter sp.]|nr:carbon-nitrogen hydrolase family protein [Rubrobacter sp.]
MANQRRGVSVAQVIHGGFGLGDSGTADAMFLAPVLQTYTVATLNLSPEPGEVEGNLLLAERAITEAKHAHSDLKWAVLPELFTSGYSDLTLVHRNAEDAQRGVSVRFFTSLACDLGLYVAYGFPERLPGTVGAAGVSDSANLVGPDGLALTYRKRHLVRTTLEYHVFVPGTDLPVVEADGVRVACIICWDLGFPEVARKAALAGADLILAPASWRAPWGLQYELSCAARALDNAIYLASANQLGVYPEARFDTPGHIYGPDGLRLSTAEDERSVSKVDHNASKRWRTLYGSTLIDDIEHTPLEVCL